MGTSEAEMASLIERLEKAAGPDNQLSYDIAIALGTYHRSAHRWPHYTGSFDDAITLVPKKLPWSLIGHANGYFYAEVGMSPEQVSSASPVIALCIAALKSRACKPKEK